MLFAIVADRFSLVATQTSRNAIVAKLRCGQLGLSPESLGTSDYPISTAKRGLITSSMIAVRSSNGMNADSIALIVNRARSVQP